MKDFNIKKQRKSMNQKYKYFVIHYLDVVDSGSHVTVGGSNNTVYVCPPDRDSAPNLSTPQPKVKKSNPAPTPTPHKPSIWKEYAAEIVGAVLALGVVGITIFNHKNNN